MLKNTVMLIGSSVCLAAVIALFRFNVARNTPFNPATFDRFSTWTIQCVYFGLSLVALSLSIWAYHRMRFKKERLQWAALFLIPASCFFVFLTLVGVEANYRVLYLHESER